MAFEMTSMLVRRTLKVADAVVQVPGDKSISHRALMCAAVAQGISTIYDANRGADVLATLAALRALGVSIVTETSGAIIVRGVQNFVDPSDTLDCGNSGSTMRMLAGLLAGRVNAVLDGDNSLRRRPMLRVAEPLQAMGADVTTAGDGRPPLTIRRVNEPLRGAKIELPIASAQVKTAILYAGLCATGETTVVETLQTRDHTERMLKAMGANLDVRETSIVVRPSTLAPIDRLSVPGDFSAAFFFIAAAAASAGSRVRIPNVGVNPTRTAALDVASQMGATIALAKRRDEFGEPVAEIDVTGNAGLRGVRVRDDLVPNLIDEIPALCALAAFAQGEFSVRGAAELRSKESDRIATTAALLRSFGADVEEFPDGIAVRGGRRLLTPKRVDTYGDHRIGMSAAILALSGSAPLEIGDAECIATSFPTFESVWQSAFG